MTSAGEHPQAEQSVGEHLHAEESVGEHLQAEQSAGKRLIVACAIRYLHCLPLDTNEKTHKESPCAFFLPYFVCKSIVLNVSAICRYKRGCAMSATLEYDILTTKSDIFTTKKQWFCSPKVPLLPSERATLALRKCHVSIREATDRIYIQ